MLVLTRKKGESIVIGHEITVTVMDVRGDNVRLGITADPDIPIHRKEIEDIINETKNETTD